MSAAFACNQPHPDLVHHFSTLLRSINDMMMGGEGTPVPPLSPVWMTDCHRATLNEDA